MRLKRPGIPPHRRLAGSKALRWLRRNGRFPDEIIAGPILLAVGAFAAAVGARDLLVTGYIEGRLVGLAMVVIGCTDIVVGSRVMKVDKPAARQLAVVAGVLSALLGAALLTAQERGGDPGAMTPLWVAIILGSALSAALAYRRREDWSTLSSRARGAVAASVSLGVVLTAVQFYYGSFYLAAREAPALSLTTELTGGGSVERLKGVTGTIRVKNTSGTRVLVLGSVYTITGSRAKRQELSARELAQEFARPATATPTSPTTPPTAGSRYVKEQALTTIKADEITSGGGQFVFEPNEEITKRVVAHVPSGYHDLLRLTAYTEVMKADKVELGGKLPLPQYGKVIELEDGGMGVLLRRSIDEASWVGSLIRDKRSLTFAWIVAAPPDQADATPVPYPVTAFMRNDEGAADVDLDDVQRLSKQYGVASTQSTSELILGR